MKRTKGTLEREIADIKSLLRGLPEAFWAERIPLEARLEELEKELLDAPEGADERDTRRRQPPLSRSRTARRATLYSIGELPDTSQRSRESA